MYDAASPRPALNTVTLFVLWLETPALFPHSIYHTVSSWADTGGPAGSAGSAGATQPSIFTGRDQKSRVVVSSDKWRIPLPFQKHLSQFVRLLISADARFWQYFLVLSCAGVFLHSLFCSLSEIKDGASGLGVGARRRWHLPFTPARHLLASRARSRVTSHNKERCPELSSIKMSLLWPIKRQWTAGVKGAFATWSDSEYSRRRLNSVGNERAP